MAVYLICYLASYILARFDHYLVSGVLLLAAAIWLYMEDYRKYKNLIHLRGLFSLFWVGGEGLNCSDVDRSNWTGLPETEQFTDGLVRHDLVLSVPGVHRLLAGV